tara:strand:- start:790 stop:1866 length:1077 start_codon:yes stop_codon:yes gene_type:complete
MFCILGDCNKENCHHCFPIINCKEHKICIEEGYCDEYNGSIMVTGSCGFIGRHVCEKFLNNNYSIIGIDNLNNFIYDSSFKIKNKEILSKYEKYKHFTKDFTDEDFIKIFKPDIIIHLAAYANVRKSNLYPYEYVKNNIENTCRLLEFLKNNKNVNYNPLFLYASSSSVYGNNEKAPFCEDDELNNLTSLYALSKKSCEEMINIYCNNYKLKAIGFRFFTVYGPGCRPDMAIHNFLKNIYQEKEVNIYGDGSMKRDFTFIDDIVNGIYNSTLIKIEGGTNKIYNLGNNTPISVSELINLCSKIIGKKPIIKYSDVPLGDVKITYANIDKSKTEINYNPCISIYEGLNNTFQYLKENFL